jgi:hypothetical protein
MWRIAVRTMTRGCKQHSPCPEIWTSCLRWVQASHDRISSRALRRGNSSRRNTNLHRSFLVQHSSIDNIPDVDVGIPAASEGAIESNHSDCKGNLSDTPDIDGAHAIALSTELTTGHVNDEYSPGLLPVVPTVSASEYDFPLNAAADGGGDGDDTASKLVAFLNVDQNEETQAVDEPSWIFV